MAVELAVAKNLGVAGRLAGCPSLPVSETSVEVEDGQGPVTPGQRRRSRSADAAGKVDRIARPVKILGDIPRSISDVLIQQ